MPNFLIASWTGQNELMNLFLIFRNYNYAFYITIRKTYNISGSKQKFLFLKLMITINIKIHLKISYNFTIKVFYSYFKKVISWNIWIIIKLYQQNQSTVAIFIRSEHIFLSNKIKCISNFLIIIYIIIKSNCKVFYKAFRIKNRSCENWAEVDILNFFLKSSFLASIHIFYGQSIN